MTDIRDVVDSHRFLVFAALTLGLAAVVFVSGMDPAPAPFILIVALAVASGTPMSAAFSGLDATALVVPLTSEPDLAPTQTSVA